MNFLHDAMAAVQRNARALLIYVGGNLAVAVILLGGDFLLAGGQLAGSETVPVSLRAYRLALQLLTAPALAAITAVAFARIGKEMDRPLWRSPNDRDALRRFFQLWLIFFLLSIATDHLHSLAQSLGTVPLAALLIILNLLLFFLFVPVGACIMFAGGFHWREFGKDLAPLAFNVPRTLLLVLINFFQLVVLLKVQSLRGTEDSLRILWLTPLATVIGAYLDCLVFAGTWILCIEHRSADEDVDFDF